MGVCCCGKLYFVKKNTNKFGMVFGIDWRLLLLELNRYSELGAVSNGNCVGVRDGAGLCKKMKLGGGVGDGVGSCQTVCLSGSRDTVLWSALVLFLF